MSVIGLRVGPFEIVQPADVPEPGEWYRARRTGMTRRQPTDVLVKLLAPDADADARAALQLEFDSLRAMEDARVPAAVAYYEGIGAIAIDAPDGVGLDEVVEARRQGALALGPPTLLDLALEVAETLQHAHHRNRLHGHLHARSIRVSLQGRLHVFGFGMGPRSSLPDPWMPPERARGEPATPATDQWSLAAVMCALITGTPPWSSDDPRAQALQGDPEGLVEPIERQWPALARLLRRMLQPDPANRHPSMQPVRTELLALARKAGGTSERRELAQRMALQVDRSLGAADPDGPPTAVPPEPEEAQAPVPADEPPPPYSESPAEAEPAPTVPAPTPTPVQRRTPAPAPRVELPRPPEPVQAQRDEDGVLTPTRPAPLVSEPLVPVLPVLTGEDVPRARRDDEDISDDPTVRADPRVLEGYREPAPAPRMEPVDPPSDPDEEPSLPNHELARVLAVDPTPPPAPAARMPRPPPPLGEGPTAVPTTDVSDDDEPPSVLPSSHFNRSPDGAADIPPRPMTPVVPMREPGFGFERPDVDTLTPEIADAVRMEGLPTPRRSVVQAVAPFLVIGMLILMLASVALALW